MKTSYLLSAALVVALTACASTRPEATGTQTLAAVVAESSVPVDVVATPAEPAADDDALVCDQIRVIGSLIPKRVCKTRAQIREEQESGRSYTESMQGSGPSRDPSAPRDLGKFGAPRSNPR